MAPPQQPSKGKPVAPGAPAPFPRGDNLPTKPKPTENTYEEKHEKHERQEKRPEKRPEKRRDKAEKDGFSIDAEGETGRNGAKTALLTDKELREIRAAAEREAEADFLAEAAKREARAGAQGRAAGSGRAPGSGRRTAEEQALMAVEAGIASEITRVDGLSLHRLAVGMLLWGVVKAVKPSSAVVSLPNGITGNLSSTEVSAVLDGLLDLDDEDSEGSANQDNAAKCPAFSCLFRPGQYLRVVIVELDAATRKVELSVRPNLINAGLDREALGPGSTVQVCVKSKEDHGYVMDAGIAGVSAFVSNSHAQAYLASVGRTSLRLGEVVEAALLAEDQGSSSADGKQAKKKQKTSSSSSSSSSRKALALTLDPSAVASAVEAGREDFTLRSLKPGTLLETKLKKVVNYGLVLGLLGDTLAGSVDLGHLRGPLDTLSQYRDPGALAAVDENHHSDDDYESSGSADALEDKRAQRKRKHKHTKNRKQLGNVALARVIYVDVGRKLIGLSLRPQLVKREPPAFGSIAVGTIIEDARIVRIDRSVGLHLALPDPASGGAGASASIAAFCHATQALEDNDEGGGGGGGGGGDPEPLANKFKVNETHRCRVLWFNELDGTAAVTLRPSMIEQPIMGPEDLHPGMKVTGVVSSVESYGLLVSITKSITGLVPTLHIAETNMKNPEKKFQVGRKVTCRVLTVDLETRRVQLTLKKSIVESEFPPVVSYASLRPGTLALGVIVSVTPAGCLLLFFNNIKAFIPASELTEEPSANPSEGFFAGQVVRCRILFASAASGRASASLKNLASALQATAKVGASGGAEGPLSAAEERALAQWGMPVERNEDQIKRETGKKFGFGSLHTAVAVTRQGAANIIVRLDDKEAYAVLPTHHLTDAGPDVAAVLASALGPGAEIPGQVMVLRTASDERRMVVTAKPVLIACHSRDAELVPHSAGRLEAGQVICGTVSNKVAYGAFLEFGENVKALVPTREVADLRVADPMAELFQGQTVFASVTSVVDGKVLCSLKPSAVGWHGDDFISSFAADLVRASGGARPAPGTVIEDAVVATGADKGSRAPLAVTLPGGTRAIVPPICLPAEPPRYKAGDKVTVVVLDAFDTSAVPEVSLLVSDHVLARKPGALGGSAAAALSASVLVVRQHYLVVNIPKAAAPAPAPAPAAAAAADPAAKKAKKKAKAAAAAEDEGVHGLAIVGTRDFNTGVAADAMCRYSPGQVLTGLKLAPSSECPFVCLSLKESPSGFTRTILPGAAASGSGSSSRENEFEDPSLTGVQDLVPGRAVQGRLIGFGGEYLHVALGRAIRGRVFATDFSNDLGDLTNVSDLARAATIGSVLTFTVLGTADQDRHNSHHSVNPAARLPLFDLSLRTGRHLKVGLAIDNIKPGDALPCVVNTVDPSLGLWVTLSRGIKGIITLVDISTSLDVLRDLEARFPAGSIIPRAVVISIDQAKQRLSLSLIPDCALPLEKRKGPIIARIHKVFATIAFAQVPHIVGVNLPDAVVDITDILDIPKDRPLETLTQGQLVTATIVEVPAKKGEGEGEDKGKDKGKDKDKAGGSKKRKKAPTSSDSSSSSSSSAGGGDGGGGGSSKHAGFRRDRNLDAYWISLRSDASRRSEVTPKTLVPGATVFGYVQEVIQKRGVYVYLGRGISGRVLFKDLAVRRVVDPVKSFPVGKLVRAVVVSVSPEVGHVQLSIKAAESGAKSLVYSDLNIGDKFWGTVTRVVTFGVFVELEGSDLSGLCYKSELSDTPGLEETELKRIKTDDRVRVKVIRLNKDDQKISLSMKPSHFRDDDDEEADEARKVKAPKTKKKSKVVHEEEDEDEEEEEEEDGSSESDDEDGDEASAASSNSSSSNSSSSSSRAIDVSMDWGDDLPAGAGAGKRGPLKPARRASDASDASSASSGGSSSGRAKRKADETRRQRKLDKHARSQAEAELRRKEHELADDEREPESVSDFERLVMASPDSSLVWLRYAGFLLNLSQVKEARAVMERALRTVRATEEVEKLNIYVAYMNLENQFGTPDALMAVFQRACTYNDPKKVHLQLLTLLEASEKTDLAEQIYRASLKRFGQSKKFHIRYGEFKFKNGWADQGRKVLQRALEVLPKHKHLKTIIPFALLEYRHGDPERGRTVLESIVSEYPKRVDVWGVYLDQEIKKGNTKHVRLLFNRVVSLPSLSSKNSKTFFKKWLSFEKDVAGNDPAAIEAVKRKAREVVERGGGGAK